jgi:pimeloyl-ACP methyl ester carboxylesterase
MTAAPLTFGDVDNHQEPLAILVHGFPDTPHTFRHLGPRLIEAGYRAVAPWLPGYTSAVEGPISVGTYAQHVLTIREQFGGDERCLLIGHDWGAMAAYGAVGVNPGAFQKLITLAVPPTAAISDAFTYAQLRRSFYIYVIQQVGIAELAVLKDGFWEGLWGDWSPGYDAREDIAMLRSHVTAETISGVLAPYRAQFNPAYADPHADTEAAAALTSPGIPTLYLHGVADGALGAEVLHEVDRHLPAAGSHHLLLPDMGHFLHLEAPDRVWEVIEKWLAD